MKTCSKCLTPKDAEKDFSKKGDGRQPWCKACNSKRSKKYYADNRDKQIAAVRARNDLAVKLNQQFVIGFLREHPCVDCNESDIIVLEFDHQGDKKAGVSQAIHAAWSLKRLQSEIAKCEVVCANCHRRRTAKTQGHFKYLAGVTQLGRVGDF